MKQTFSQHELEIIKGHKQILETTDKEKIEDDLKKMIALLTSNGGKQYLKDDMERHYTLKHYQSTYKKIKALNEQEFLNLDFSLLDYFDS